MKRKRIKQIASLILPALLIACSVNSVQWTEFPIIEGAENIQQYNLEKVKAHQISFILNAEYPSTEVAEFYFEQVKSPWVRCFGEMKWQSHADATQTPSVFIHQLLMHWVNFESNRLLLLGFRYVSEGINYREMPNNDVQNVNLLEYKEMSLEEAISTLGLNCERT